MAGPAGITWATRRWAEQNTVNRRRSCLRAAIMRPFYLPTYLRPGFPPAPTIIDKWTVRRLRGQVIFANRLTTTFSTSGKSLVPYRHPNCCEMVDSGRKSLKFVRFTDKVAPWPVGNTDDSG